MLVIGHRGARGLAPENTLAGFQAALDIGVDGIEFDVRVTKDGVPVLMHDDHIPVGSHYLYIADAPLGELRADKPDLATLDEALSKLMNKTSFVMEVKPEVDTEPIIACLQRFMDKGLKLESFRVSSFDPKVLRALKRALPSVTPVVNEKWSGVRATYRARKLGTIYITMNQKWLWGGFIRSVAHSGYKLTAYTVNDPAKAKRWAAAGLYAAITDFPDRFR